jgi:hypothetical protein
MHTSVVPTVATAAKHHWTTRLAFGVARDQLAGLLREVEHDRGRLGDDEAVVVDDRHLPEGGDPPVGFAVELAAGVVERVDAVRQAELLERPLRPEVLRLATPFGEDASEAVERDHGALGGRPDRIVADG